MWLLNNTIFMHVLFICGFSYLIDNLSVTYVCRVSLHNLITFGEECVNKFLKLVFLFIVLGFRFPCFFIILCSPILVLSLKCLTLCSCSPNRFSAILCLVPMYLLLLWILGNLNDTKCNPSDISDQVWESTRHTLITGDSTVKHFDQWRLSKYKSQVRVISYPCCTIKRLGEKLEKIADNMYVQPEQFDNIILSIGSNYILSLWNYVSKTCTN